MLNAVLVSVDLSPGSARVLQRALRLPLAAGARLTLLHVVPRHLAPAARARAERDARRALAALAKGCRGLRPGSRVRPLVVTGACAAAIAAQARAMRAELVVVGRVGARALRDAFIGSNAERVLRSSRLPVLVVRRWSRAPYRRPVLALDFDAAAVAALAFLPRVLPVPPPPAALVHVDDAPFAAQVYPSLTAAAARSERRRRRSMFARRLARLQEAAAPSGELSWVAVLRSGSPRLTLPNLVAARRADLLALGTRGRSGIAQMFLGTVAGDVLRSVSCDVLLVPPRRGGVERRRRS